MSMRSFRSIVIWIGLVGLCLKGFMRFIIISGIPSDGAHSAYAPDELWKAWQQRVSNSLGKFIYSVGYLCTRPCKSVQYKSLKHMCQININRCESTRCGEAVPSLRLESSLFERRFIIECTTYMARMYGLYHANRSWCMTWEPPTNSFQFNWQHSLRAVINGKCFISANAKKKSKHALLSPIFWYT